MSVPQSNATITAITAPGLTRDWESAPTTGLDRWTGTARAYLLRAITRRREGGTVDLIQAWSIYIPAHLPMPAVGDTITVTPDHEDALTVCVDAVMGVRAKGAVAPVAVTLRAA